MAIEQFKNVPITTLSGGVNNSSDPVTVPVTSAALFPATGNFRILIGSEILKVTSVSGSDFTAVRATEGTSIATHLTGDSVQLVLTADSLDQTIKDRFSVDTENNYNTNGARVQQCSDIGIAVFNKTHAQRSPLMPIHEFDPTGWTWFNQGGATITRSGLFSSLFSMPSAGGNIRGLLTPYTPGQTIEAWFELPAYLVPNSQVVTVGLTIANSGNAKKVMFWPRWTVSGGFPIYDVDREYWSDNTTFGGSQSTIQYREPRAMSLIRVTDDGAGTATTLYSANGIDFATHDVYNYSGNFTADRCGIGFFNNSGITIPVYIHNFRIF